MPTQLRWGIVSAGKISNDFCIGLRSDPEKKHKIMAVAAREKSKADEFAKKHEIPMSYGNYEEMANNPDIDVFYVGNTNNGHYPVVMMLLKKKKNVLCEKPLGMNVREVSEMINLAKSQNVFFMEGMWARFFPVQERLRAELKKKSLGDVKLVTVTFGVSGDILSDRVLKPELGGGVIMDMGVYCIALSQMVFGEYPRKITAIGYLNDYGCDVFDSVTLEYSHNRISSFQLSCVTQVPNEANICGTKGTIQISKPFWCSDKMYIKDKEHTFPFPQPVAKSIYDNGVGFLYEADEVKRCIDKGLKESSIVSHNDSMEFASIIEQCRKLMGVKYEQDNQN